jgi:hypothetical protein
MNEINKAWTKNTIIDEKLLICDCGQEAEIIHCSNWHNGQGVFYVKCRCGLAWNIPWEEKKEVDSVNCE